VILSGGILSTASPGMKSNRLNYFCWHALKKKSTATI